MKRSFDLGRRLCLRLAVVLAGAGALPLKTLAAQLAGAEGRACSPADLANLLTCQGSARRLGREYLRLHPEEANRRTLMARLALPEGLPKDELRAWVAARQREDFRRGHTVRVHGWVLAATEVRLCALSALI